MSTIAWMLTIAGIMIAGGFIKIAYDVAFYKGWQECYQQFFASGDFEIRIKTEAGARMISDLLDCDDTTNRRGIAHS